MELYNGTFKTVSQTGLAEAVKIMGLSKRDCELALDPDNYITITTSFEDGVFRLKEVHSKASILNIDINYKLGEENELNIGGMKLKCNCLKKSDDCFVLTSDSAILAKCELKFRASGLTMTSHHHSYTYSAEYVRCEPKIDGYYVFQREEGIETYMKKRFPDMDTALLKKALQSCALRISTYDDIITMEEHFGDAMPTKNFAYKLDQEFNYKLEGLGMDSTGVMVCTGPGMYKIVSKDCKNGRLEEHNWIFTRDGFKMNQIQLPSGIKQTTFFRRVPDMLGSFKMVTHTELTNYFDALEIPSGARKSVTPPVGMKLTTTRCGFDLLWMESDTPVVPGVVFRLGEEYTYSVPVPGSQPITAKCVITATETGNIQVSKVGDKVIVMKSDITGDFLISCFEVQGKPGSGAKMIFVRC